MPRLPEPRTPALRELAKQLRFQPAEASRRQLDRVEDLALQLLTEHQPQREWPVEWVVFRVTGFRVEIAAPELSGTVTAQALLHDLGALVQILSAATRDTDTALRNASGNQWLTLEELRARWDVSRQTIDRYRQLGLFSRRVRVARSPGKGRGSAPHRTLFDRTIVEAFERTHPDTLTHAAAFSRTDRDLSLRLHRRAARYQHLLGWSLTRIAQRLAPRIGRSVGAVRRSILAADADCPAPLFPARRPLRAAGKAEAVYKFGRGGRARDIARTTGRSRASVYRMVASERVRRLRSLNLTGPARPDFAAPRASGGPLLLRSPEVTQGLGRPLPHTITELIEHAATTEAAAPREHAIGSAYALLRFECTRAIGELGGRPTILGSEQGKARARPGAAVGPSIGIDWIETHLRWASRLKVELVRSQLGLLLRTIESQLARPLAAIPGASAVGLVETLAGAIFDAADRHDPFKGGRLAAPAGIALNRAAARWLEAHPLPAASATTALAPARSLARPVSSHARLDHIWVSITPWDAWLEPPQSVRDRVDSLVGRERAVLLARLGWDARPPRTVIETARERSMAPLAVIRVERSAMRRLL